MATSVRKRIWKWLWHVFRKLKMIHPYAAFKWNPLGQMGCEGNPVKLEE